MVRTARVADDDEAVVVVARGVGSAGDPDLGRSAASMIVSIPAVLRLSSRLVWKNALQRCLAMT